MEILPDNSGKIYVYWSYLLHNKFYFCISLIGILFFKKSLPKLIIRNFYMNSLIEKLQELGLSRREAEVYLALLQKREITAPEVSRITSVSRTKSYEILGNLVKKNVCRVLVKNGSKFFSGIEPEIAVKNLVFQYEQELETKKNVAEQCVQRLKDFNKAKDNVTDTMDYIEVISDSGQIKDRWLIIEKNTQKELLVFTKQPYAMDLKDNVSIQASMTKRKIKVRGVYEYGNINSEIEKEQFIGLLERFQKLDEEARIVKELPMKLVISDETITMFALNDRISLRPSITTMIVNHHSFAIALKQVFESYWNMGLTIEEYKNNKHNTI